MSKKVVKFDNFSGTQTFYVPTTVGTSGYYLKSNGSGAPSWTAFSKSTVGLGNVANALQVKATPFITTTPTTSSTTAHTSTTALPTAWFQVKNGTVITGYTYTIKANLHGRGAYPQVRLYVGNEEVYDSPSTDSSGNVVLSSNYPIAIRVYIW